MKPGLISPSKKGIACVLIATIALVVSISIWIKPGGKRAEIEIAKPRIERPKPSPPVVPGSGGALILETIAKDGKISISDYAAITGSAFSPETAKILLERIRSGVTNIDERSQLCAGVMVALCKQGYGEEAWELIDTEGGVVRELEIGAIFQTYKGDVDNLLEKLKSVTEPIERLQALGGLLRSRPSEIAAINFDEISLSDPKEKMTLSTFLLSAINDAKKNGDLSTGEAILRKSLNLLQSGKLSVDDLSRILSGDKSNASIQQWEIIKSSKGNLAAKDAEKLRLAIVPKMIKEDMGKSMITLTSDSDTKLSYPILNRAVESMFEVDPSAAQTWLDRNLLKLDRETSQRITTSMTQISLKKGDLAAAKEWSAQITNAHIRGQIEQQIKKAQLANKPQ